MNKETWKVVRGYEGLYEVSNLGRIRSLGRECNSKNNSRQRKRARILTQEITVHGYCRVRLYDAEGKAKHWAVHRLVLLSFIGPSELQVNHINEIKTDNRLVNLEYCTAKKNCNHGKRNNTISLKTKGLSSRPVRQIDKNGNVIGIYPSRMDAEKETGVNAAHIGKVCSGTRTKAGGFEWRDA